MVSLDSILSRRELFKLGGITAAYLVIPASEDRLRALTPLIKQRQQFLDQLVEKELSPYAGRVIYDHNRSLSMETSNLHARRTLDDPQALRYFLKYPDYFPRNFNLTEEQIKGIEEVPKLIKDLIAFIVQIVQIDKPHDAYAVVKPYPSDFGKGVKPDIFVFGGIFEKLFIETPQKVIEIPIEERVRATLQHEYTHAEDNYKGINLGEGLVIDNSNHFDIHPRVKKFVIESRGYSRAVEFSRQFGRDHPVYWFELGQLVSNMAGIYNKDIRDRKFTPYETRLIEFQKKKVDDINQETKRIFEKYKLK